MAAPIPILADDDPFGIFFACLFLLIFVVGGAYLAIWLRKRYWGPDDVGVPGIGFTIGDLRQMHRSGQLSDQEFQRAKEKIVAAHQAAAAAPKTDPPNLPPAGR